MAHLVLSLKSDIQKLTEKVENQAVILDAVVNANTMNLSPMFEQTFQEKYNLKVPFTRIEDFKMFNDELETNAKFCHEFVREFQFIKLNIILLDVWKWKFFIADY